MLKKDNYLVGGLAAIVIPALLYVLFVLFMEGKGAVMTSTLHEKFQLVLIAINAVLMRLFLVNKKFDRAGRAVMLVTMIGALCHFTYFYTDLF